MVSLVFIFSVCQILFVQVYGITLPFTSLAYTSVPSNPQCQVPTPTDEKRLNSPSSATGIKNVDNIETTSYLQKSVRESPPKLVIHEPSTKCKERPEQFTRPLLDLNKKSNQTNETPMAINNIINSYSKCPPTTTAKRENVLPTKNTDSASVPKPTQQSVQESPGKSYTNLRVTESKEYSMASNIPQSLKTDLNTNYQRKDKSAEINNISSYSKAPPLTTTVKRENVLPTTSPIKKADSAIVPKLTLQGMQESPQNSDNNEWVKKSTGNSKASVLPLSTNTDINRNYQRKDKPTEIMNIGSYSYAPPSTSTAKKASELPTSDVKNVDFVKPPQLSQQNMQEYPQMFVNNSLVTELQEYSMESTSPQLEPSSSYRSAILKNVENVSAPPFLHQIGRESNLDPINYSSITKTKENSERSTLPQFDLTKNSKAVETSININNLIKSNTAGIPDISILPPINLCYSGNSMQKKNMNQNDCYTKYTLIEDPPTNFISGKDIKSVNLKSSPPIVVKAVPYDTNRLNSHNVPPIFIDCSKQTSVPPNLNLNSLQLDQKFIPQQLITQSVASGNSLCGAIEEEGIYKVPFVSNDCVMVSRPDEILNDGLKSLDINQHKQYLNIETPVTVNKIFYPSISELKYVNDILPNSANNLKNSNEAIFKIKSNSDVPNNNNGMNLFVATTGINGNNKLTTLPHNIKPCEYQSLNTKAVSNNLNVQTPPISYAYIPKEIPILSQLPNVIPEITSSAFKDTIFTVSNPYNTMSHTHTYISEPIPQPKPTENILVPVVNSKNYFNSPTLSLTVPKSLDYIPSSAISSNSQSKVVQVPNILQLPNVYTNSEMLLSQPALQCSPSLPTNTVVIKTPDLTCGNLQSRILPPLPLKSEMDTKPPKELQYTVQVLPSAKETFNVPELNAGSYIMPTYQSNYLSSSNALPSNSFPSINNDKPLSSQLAEHVTPKMTSQSPHINLPYADTREFTVSPEASSFGNSLNSLISSLTSSLLSAFYDLSAKSEKEIVGNVPTLQDTIISLPYLIHPETSIPLSMPVFTLSPPILSSPVSLPTPKVKLPSKRVGKKSSGKKKLSSSKLPKTYISSVLINILPPQELPNEIIVIV